jgi:hypothetical protein
MTQECRVGIDYSIEYVYGVQCRGTYVRSAIRAICRAVLCGCRDRDGYALAFLSGNMTVNVAWMWTLVSLTNSPWQGLGDVYGVEN